MVRSARVLRLVVSIAAAAVLSGGSAWALSGGFAHQVSGAASSSPTTTTAACKPGWGYGDKNHCHPGPPGLATSTSTSGSTTSTGSTTTSSASTTTTSTTTTTAVTTAACKPGWGYGDKNHCHSGPPGRNGTPHRRGHGHG